MDASDAPPAPAADDAHPGAAPDWTTFAGAVMCPMCEYDLRGLAEPRCPECGYRFEWREVLDADRRLHPYIFEHHPDRPVWSFVQTVYGGLNPRTFWRRLRPGQRSSLNSLMVFVAIVSVMTLSAALAVGSFCEPDNFSIFRAIIVRPLRASSWRFPLDIWLRPLQRSGFTWRLLLFFAAWPWLTFMALLVFAQPMGRAKVRRAHVFRCVAYTFDAMILLAVAAALVAALSMNLMLPEIHQAALIDVAVIAIWLILIYRLRCAYALYMRFDHALATVLASQVIVLLWGLAAMQILGRL